MSDPVNDAPPPMGHNAPNGLPTVDQLADQLLTENQAAIDRVEELLAKGAKYLTINSDEEDAAATEFLVPIRARFKQSEADRVARKTVFDDLAGAVQAFFKSKILDPLGAAPSNKNEEFDPLLSTQYGLGVRITMAQTLYKRRKVREEQQRRDAAAAAARKAEADAKAKRDAEAKVLKDKADAEAKALKEKQDAEEKVRREAADKAAADAKALAEAASRKRNAESKAAADKAAADAKALADKLAKEKVEADRKALAEQVERDRIAAAELAERDRLALEEENRIAQERSAAEDAAAATTADLSRARGGKAGVSSLKEFLDYRDMDREALGHWNDSQPEASIVKLLPFLTDAALDKAVKDWAKANQQTVKTGIKTGKQPLPGVVFFINTKSAGRA